MAITNVEHLSLALLLSFSTFAYAENVTHPLESEEFYFKALPYLKQIDDAQNELMNTRNKLPASTPLSEQIKEKFRSEIKPLFEAGMPLLRRSAAEGNPAAQYRLAWISALFEPYEQAVDQVCPLLRASLSQGFTPAGVQMINYCLDEAKTPGFRSLIDALPDSDTLFSKYYPLPTLIPGCDRSRASENNVIALLDEKAFRANLYMSVSAEMSRQHLKQEQLAYLNKAAEYGCTRAIERLKLEAGNW